MFILEKKQFKIKTSPSLFKYPLEVVANNVVFIHVRIDFKDKRIRKKLMIN